MIWKDACSNSCDHFGQTQLHRKKETTTKPEKKPHNQFWRHFCHCFRSVWWAESNGPAVTTNISMNCHHIHPSELGVSEAVTREEFPGKWCFSVLPLNLKLKADEGGCKSPWCCPVRGTSPQSWRLRQSSEQSFQWHSPKTDLLSPDTSFIAKKRNRTKKKMLWGRVCMCWLHITQCDAKGSSGLPEVSPESPLCPTAFLRSLLCLYTLQNKCWTTAFVPCFP